MMRFQFVRQFERFQFGRIAQAIHHVGDAAVLECFGDGFPAVLHELAGVAGFDALLDHFVEAQNRTGLQHAAQNRLFAHQIRFHFGDE